MEEKFGTIYGGYVGGVLTYDTEGISVNISICGGTIGTIYGAGQYYTSEIAGDVKISIENATITGNIYGGGKGGKVNGNIYINIGENTTISGNVFGGGLGLTDSVSTNVLSAGPYTTISATKTKYDSSAKSAGYASSSEADTGFPLLNVADATVIIRLYKQITYNATNGGYYLNLYETTRVVDIIRSLW